MKHEQKSMKDSIKKAMKTQTQTAQNANEGSDLRQTHTEDNAGAAYPQNDNIEHERDKSEEKASRKRLERPLKIFGGICIAAAIISLIFTGTPTVDTSDAARNALQNKISTSISAGTVLSAADENMEPKDYTITHSSDAESTRIWVWDYAAEDGDYIQVLVNGAPVSEAFMIRNKPRELTVPATGEVQIKGIRDGGGGITYAVRYDLNGTSYFNGAPEGEFNTYTLRKE